MKRLTLEIDLKENEAFEKEVEEIIRAKAREFARNEQAKMIEDEVKNEVERLVKGNAWGYRDKLESIVRGLTREEMKKTISDMDIENMVKKCVQDRIEYIVVKMTGEVERRCRDALETAISEEVQGKLNSILKS